MAKLTRNDRYLHLKPQPTPAHDIRSINTKLTLPWSRIRRLLAFVKPTYKPTRTGKCVNSINSIRHTYSNTDSIMHPAYRGIDETPFFEPLTECDTRKGPLGTNRSKRRVSRHTQCGVFFTFRGLPAPFLYMMSHAVLRTYTTTLVFVFGVLEAALFRMNGHIYAV